MYHSLAPHTPQSYECDGIDQWALWHPMSLIPYVCHWHPKYRSLTPYVPLTPSIPQSESDTLNLTPFVPQSNTVHTTTLHMGWHRSVGSLTPDVCHWQPMHRSLTPYVPQSSTLYTTVIRMRLHRIVGWLNCQGSLVKECIAVCVAGCVALLFVVLQ